MSKPYYGRWSKQDEAAKRRRMLDHQEAWEKEKEFRKSQYDRSRRNQNDYRRAYVDPWEERRNRILAERALEKKRKEFQLYRKWEPTIVGKGVKLVPREAVRIPQISTDWMVFDNDSKEMLRYENDMGEETDGKGNVIKKRKIAKYDSPEEILKRKEAAKAKLLSKYKSGYLPSTENSLKFGMSYDPVKKIWY